MILRLTVISLIISMSCNFLMSDAGYVREIRLNAMKADSANVLLINMFPEALKGDRELHTSILTNRIETTLKEKYEHITINSISPSGASTLQQRQKDIYKVIKIMSKVPYYYTHIFIAGHGTSKAKYLQIGDLAFSNYSINDLVKNFSELPLAPKVKIFLFGCSTFDGTEDEIVARATFFKRIFKTSEIEVFGYKHPILSDTSLAYWDMGSTEAMASYVGLILIVFLKEGEREGMFVNRNWRNYFYALCAFPAASGFNFIYHLMRDTRFVTLLREYIFSNHVGTVVAFDKQGEVQTTESLGHDYFKQRFVEH